MCFWWLSHSSPEKACLAACCIVSQKTKFNIKCKNSICFQTWWSYGIQRRTHEFLSPPYCLLHQEQQSGDLLLADPEKTQCRPSKLLHLETEKIEKKKDNFCQKPKTFHLFTSGQFWGPLPLSYHLPVSRVQTELWWPAPHVLHQGPQHSLLLYRHWRNSWGSS